MSEAIWLKRGRQRRAVARVLQSPMTASQILEQARLLAPHIQLRDVWFIVRQFEARGLIECLNPGLGNGKVYFLTGLGITASAAAFGHTVQPVAGELDWASVGKVARGRVRQSVLEEIAKPQGRSTRGKSASEIRKNLVERRPMELSRAIRAVEDLTRLKLIRVSGWTTKPRRKLYRLTLAGHRVVEMLKRVGKETQSRGP